MLDELDRELLDNQEPIKDEVLLDINQFSRPKEPVPVRQENLSRN